MLCVHLVMEWGKVQPSSKLSLALQIPVESFAHWSKQQKWAFLGSLSQGPWCVWCTVTHPRHREPWYSWARYWAVECFCSWPTSRHTWKADLRGFDGWNRFTSRRYFQGRWQIETRPFWKIPCWSWESGALSSVWSPLAARLLSRGLWNVSTLMEPKKTNLLYGSIV